MPENPKRIVIVPNGDGWLISRGPWTLEWEDIGEGNSGDYDPEDHADYPHLRANLSYKGADCAKGSYCTEAHAETTIGALLDGTLALFDELKEPAEADLGAEVHFNHHAMERWTWRQYPMPEKKEK